MHRFVRILGSSLIVLGIGLLVVVGALYLYGVYERYRFEHTLAMQTMAEAALGIDILEGERATPSPPEQVLLEDPRPADDTVREPFIPTPEQPKRMPPAKWTRIPKIEVDSPVVEAPLEKGEWQAPKFVAGHLEGTANPGEVGNVALSGHVESIASGNVFARLKEVSVGDEVILVAGGNTLTYTVAEIKVLKNDDLAVVMPTTEPVLTLITCTGTWNPLTRDYSERLVVVAKPTDKGGP